MTRRSISSGDIGILRTPAAQKMVAGAALPRMQQILTQRARQNNRVNVPQPMAPSVAGLRGNDAEADIRSLQQRLEGQSGRNALMTAVELQKARRRAGGVG